MNKGKSADQANEQDRFKLNILENCLSFTEESIHKCMGSKENSRAWKFAIVHAVQAIELSLNSRSARLTPLDLEKSGRQSVSHFG